MEGASTNPNPESAVETLDRIDPVLTAFSKNLWKFPETGSEDPPSSLTVNLDHRLKGNGNPKVFPETPNECEAPINLHLCRLVEVEANPEIQKSFDDSLAASETEPIAETPLEYSFFEKAYPTNKG